MKRCIAVIAILALLLTCSMPTYAVGIWGGSSGCGNGNGYSQEAVLDLIRDLLTNRYNCQLPGTSASPACTPVCTPSCTPQTTATAKPSQTPTVTATVKPSQSPTVTATVKPTQTPTVTASPEPSATAAPSTTEASYAAEVVRLVNEERAKEGLSALTVDASVQAAAQVRAVEIKSAFSHTRPNGSSCFTALGEQGVSYRGAGENIAYGQSSPEAVMKTWMNSQGHRANIMSEKYTKIGVGCYRDANGRYYWTQFFIN